MTYGSFDVRGTQSGTAAETQIGLGPFSLAFGSVSGMLPYSIATTSTSIAVPAGAAGFYVIPPTGNTTTLTYLSNSGDSTGVAVSPQNPWYLQFDTTSPNVPSNIYFKAGSTLVVQIQWI